MLRQQRKDPRHRSRDRTDYHSADSDLKLHKKVYEELMSEAAVAAEKN